MELKNIRSNRNNIFNLVFYVKGYSYFSGYSLFFYFSSGAIYIQEFIIIYYNKKFFYVADLSFILYANKSPFTKKRKKIQGVTGITFLTFVFYVKSYRYFSGYSLFFFSTNFYEIQLYCMYLSRSGSIWVRKRTRHSFLYDCLVIVWMTLWIVSYSLLICCFITDGNKCPLTSIDV